MKYFILLIVLCVTSSAYALQIFPKQVAVLPGKKIQFCVFEKERGTAYTPDFLTWNCEKGTVSHFGLYTAPSALGKYSIKVSYKNTQVQAVVYVKSPQENGIRTIQIISDGEIYQDQEKQLKAVAYDNKGNEIYFKPIWQSRGVGKISNTGLFISDKDGEAHILLQDANSPASTFLKFKVQANNVAKVVVFPKETSLSMQGKTKFFATAYDSNGKEVSFRPTWYVEGLGSIQKNGEYTAGSYRGNAKVWAKDPVSGKKGAGSISIEASHSTGQGDIIIGTFFDHNHTVRIAYQVFGTNIKHTELHAILENGSSKMLDTRTCASGDNIVFEKYYPERTTTLEIRIFDNYNRMFGSKRQNLK